MSICQRLAHRRRVLRGGMLGGAFIVGLPLLDCFLDGAGRALAATGQALPPVYSTWYWGLGLNPGRWEPKTPGAIAALPPELEPLARFRDKINVYSGMKVNLDGRSSLPHFSGNMAILTGTAPRVQAVSIPTIDTLIADHIGAQTRFRSLEMASTGDARAIQSFRAGGAFQPAETSPAAMYVRLFGPGFQDPNAATFTPDPEVIARRSVLSAVRDQRKDLERTLGAGDKARLDEFFTSLRQLEQQLALQLEKPAPLAACHVPEAPGAAPVGSDVDMVAATHKVFTRLAAYAFACGQTHVANIVFNEMHSSLRRAGSAMEHHGYTHEDPIDPALGYQPNVAYFITRIMEGFADYLTALADIKEGDGTLLDRTLVFAVTDHGYAKVHSVDNIPMLTAGSAAGRVKTGLHVVGRGDPATRVGLTIQQALGMPLNGWGTDSMATTKTLTEILAQGS